ncbi:gamma-glutamyl-gamma-aminobutyrate hydrolase [Actinoallomurus acanthiterrae]
MSASAPVVGITAYVEPARFTVWDVTATLLPHAYVEHVVRAGGQPVLLPPAGDPSSLVDRLDALIIAGGGDLNPARYDADAHERTSHVRDFRDDAEFGLVRAAIERRLPVLGICRGLQVLNVALGGSLHQHVPDVVGDGRHCPAAGVYGRFPVKIGSGTRLAATFADERITVAHYHHQAIDRLGTGLIPTAWADDGLVEAAELTGYPFGIGVQWHPEAGDDGSLFTALVAATSAPMSPP